MCWHGIRTDRHSWAFGFASGEKLVMNYVEVLGLMKWRWATQLHAHQSRQSLVWTAVLQLHGRLHCQQVPHALNVRRNRCCTRTGEFSNSLRICINGIVTKRSLKSLKEADTIVLAGLFPLAEPVKPCSSHMCPSCLIVHKLGTRLQKKVKKTEAIFHIHSWKG